MVYLNGQGGISGKSNRGRYLRNTALENQLGEDPEQGAFGASPDLKIMACYPSDCKTSSGGDARTNKGSVTRGNVGIFSAGAHDLSLPGTVDSNVDLSTEQYSHLRRGFVILTHRTPCAVIVSCVLVGQTI